MRQQLLYKTCPDILESPNLWITYYRSPSAFFEVTFLSVTLVSLTRLRPQVYFLLFLSLSLILGLSPSLLTKMHIFLVFITKEQVENSLMYQWPLG